MFLCVVVIVHRARRPLLAKKLAERGRQVRNLVAIPGRLKPT